MRRYASAPWETFEITDLVQRGSQYAIEGKPLVPSARTHSFFVFTSETFEPEVGQMFSFSVFRISIIDDEFEGREFSTQRIARDEFIAMKGNFPDQRDGIAR